MCYENSYKNLRNGEECQHCAYERTICLQEDKCLLELQEEYMKEVDKFYAKK